MFRFFIIWFSFFCFGLWPSLWVIQREQTVSYFSPKLCTALQRKLEAMLQSRIADSSSRNAVSRAKDPLIWFSESGFIGVYPWPEFFPTATDRHRFLVTTRHVRACTRNR